VTSNPYGDPSAIPLTNSSFSTGGLHRDSFARPGKLFTASVSIVAREAGVLIPEAHRAIVKSVVKVLESGVS
jgi:mRNA interferase MazF